MCWCTTCPPSVSVMLTTHMLFPGTKIFHGVFRGQAASGLRGDANEFRQNEIPLKACEIVSCTFRYPEGPSIWSDPCIHAILWDQENIHSDEYHKRTLPVVLSNRVTFLTGQEDGHWCFCVFRERFDNVLITQLWGALLDKGSQIRIIIPYYLVMYIILQYTRQWMVKETQQTTQTCALCLIELQRANETFSISIKNISQISYCIKEN